MSQYATASPQGSTPGEPPLDWPWYGIGFGAAIKRFFKKYATFSGRASRGEYWWVVLFQFIISAVLYAFTLPSLIAATTAASQGGTAPQLGAGYYVANGLLTLWSLATLVPSLAVAWRRLHDTGRSGWYYLLGLIPLVGPIILLVFFASATTPTAERYGPPQQSAGYGAPVGGYGQQGYPQP